MSDPVFMDFEEPGDPPAPKKKRRRGKPKDEEPGKAIIPRLPEREPALTSDEVKRGVSERGRAAANLRLDGFNFQEIAEILDFPDARAAQREVNRVLAATHSPEDWETLRIVAAGRAENLFKRSNAMAGADYLLDTKTGEKVPNVEKFKWHQQAAIDLMNHAIITGAKAPTSVTITPEAGVFDQIVDRILEAGGHQPILDAEVIELEYIPPPPEDDIDDDEQ